MQGRNGGQHCSQRAAAAMQSHGLEPVPLLFTATSRC